MGTLYLVATPIGNLEDISARALRVLSTAALIAAEDTRRTQKLLEHYAIRTPSVSYHEHNKLTRIEQILEALINGDVALVSDAGTPALNDPGYELARAAIGAGFPVSPIPGPSAPLAALVASGLPTDAFTYLGYLPRKHSDRIRFIREFAEIPHTLIYLEAPHRLRDSLADLLAELGDRPAAIARELTKLHEEIFRGRLSEAMHHFGIHEPRGEFTLVVAGAPKSTRWDAEQLQREIELRAAAGESPTHAASELAAVSGWPRRTVYNLYLEFSRKKGRKNEPG